MAFVIAAKGGVMRSLRLCVLALVIAGTPTFAADTRPSEASVRQLLAVTEARKLLDGMMMQLDGMMQNSMQQALKGQTITPGQQKILDGMQTKIVALLKQEMKWENLEAVYLRVYRDSFTQEEVDGMLAFYQTPSGKAVIRKMPVVMQKSMAEMQGRMGPLTEKLRGIQEETLAEIKAQAGK
jgi:hypothetical protein